MAAEGVAGQPRATVRVGELGITADGMLYVADAKGYFAEQGLNVEFVRFDGGAAMMAPLATGQIEVAGSSGINVAMFNAMARELPIILVADNTYDGKQDILMARTDLRDQIRRPADLRGRRVAINAQGSILQYILGKALERDGLTLNDVDVQFVPFPEMRVALENRAVDAIVQVEPFATLIEQAGVGYKWLNGFDVVPDPVIQVAATMYNRDWAANNPAQARGFAVALLRGIRDMISAAHGGPNRGEVVDTLIDRTAVKDRRLYDLMEWPGLHRNGEISMDSIEDQQRWYLAQGLLSQALDVGRFVDLSYINAAAAQLGPYSGPGGY
jgi:NitT/TauT family transport system substrate-binding protein